MKILVVSNFYPPRALGGAEIVAHRHALELVKRGHEVEVFAGRTPKSEQSGGEMTLERVDGLNVHLMSIRSLEPSRSFYWSAAGRRFRSVLDHFKPDVVHFHNLSGLGVNLILEARHYGAKTVSTVHDHWGFCVKNTLLRDGGYICDDFEDCHFCLNNITNEAGQALPSRLRRDYVMRCLSEVDCLIFPSQYLADAYASAGFPTSKIRVHSNGIDVERFSAADPDRMAAARLRVAVIGYLGEHKGIEILIKAIDRLLEKPKLKGRWKVNIIGDGNLRGRINKLVADPYYRDHVDFLEKVDADEIPQLMSETDVVLLPSVWPENEPVVMLEAIASGIAQLASRAGGHPELVVDGKSGVLFERGSVDDLVEKLSLYIKDPSLARRHGAYNRERRDSFAQEKAVTAYEEIYASPASKPSREPLVICEGNWPPLEVAQFFNNLSIFEKRGKVRLIYVDWADSFLWSQASALFVWSAEPREDLLLRASRLSIPIIAPSGNRMVNFLVKEGGLGFGYKDFAEVICALVAIGDTGAIADWRHKQRPPNDFADFIAAGVGDSSYALNAERPSI